MEKFWPVQQPVKGQVQHAINEIVQLTKKLKIPTLAFFDFVDFKNVCENFKLASQAFFKFRKILKKLKLASMVLKDIFWGVVKCYIIPGGTFLG